MMILYKKQEIPGIDVCTESVNVMQMVQRRTKSRKRCGVTVYGLIRPLSRHHDATLPATTQPIICHPPNLFVGNAPVIRGSRRSACASAYWRSVWLYDGARRC